MFLSIQELVSAFKSATDDSYQAIRLQKSTLDYLVQLLTNHSYPAMEIVRLLPEALSVSTGYKAMMGMRSLNCDDDAVKFINLLSNIDWPKRYLSEIQQHIFPLILELTCNKELPDRFWLCWLSGRSFQTLEYFLQYQAKQGCSGLITHRYAFIRATIGQNHFIDDITYENCQIDANRALCITKLINEIYSSDSLSLIKIDEQLNNLITLENGFTKSLLYELKRLCLLLGSLTYFVPKFAMCYNVIDALTKELDFSHCNPEQITTILEENFRYNQHIPLLMTTTPERHSECELFDQFMVIRLCLEVILDRNIDTTTQNKLKDIKTRLRNIVSKTPYIETLEASFSLLFLRWEHVLDGTIESNSEASDNSNSPDRRRMHKHRVEKHGFVCTMDHLEAILKILKLSINQRKHSDEISDAFGERFTTISDYISDAAWRQTLFRTHMVNLKRLPIDTKKYLAMHNPPAEHRSSSDEDDHIEIDKKSDKKLTARRRPRKRNLRKLDCDRVTPLIDSHCISSSDRRCIVSKMLGSPQHLVTACMNKADTETSCQIIKVSLVIIYYCILFLHSFPSR